MRDDKPADAVTEEPVVDVENGETVETQSGSTRVQPGKHGNVTLAGQKISNADRVIDNVTGLKKIDLVRYYDEIAEWALPISKIGRSHWCARLMASKENSFFRSTKSGCAFPALRSCPPRCTPNTHHYWSSTRTRHSSA
jgi:bifunctional non-homologous end joining protein LigD